MTHGRDPSVEADAPVPEGRRRIMRGNRSRDTRPELAVRSLLYRSGLRYRVDSPLPFDRRRRADIAFPRVSIYVFIDGCFWHGCPEHYIPPRTRTEYWTSKINHNIARDRDTDERLTAEGATVLRFWEHEDPDQVANAIKASYRVQKGQLRLE